MAHRSSPPSLLGGVLPQTLDSIEELRDARACSSMVLAALPARLAVERPVRRCRIDTLQAQVQWVDHQLSVSGAADAGAGSEERPWRERVEIMNTLVQLRYVEAQRVALEGWGSGRRARPRMHIPEVLT